MLWRSVTQAVAPPCFLCPLKFEEGFSVPLLHNSVHLKHSALQGLPPLAGKRKPWLYLTLLSVSITQPRVMSSKEPADRTGENAASVSREQLADPLAGRTLNPVLPWPRMAWDC